MVSFFYIRYFLFKSLSFPPNPLQWSRILTFFIMKKLLFVLPALALMAMFSGCEMPNGMSKSEAKEAATEFINGTLMKGQATAEVTSIEKTDGMFKLKVKVNGQEVDSYISADGKTFFPQVIDIESVKAAVAGQAAAAKAAPAAAMTKSDKPVIELFVMSYCPFGTQIEKGMLPVLEALGDSVDFQLKFVDYAMHGKKELDENLNQVCIQKNEPEKLVKYLKCFLTAGEGKTCLDEVGIDTDGLSTCVSAMDKEFKITELFKDKTTWNGGRFPQFPVDKELDTKYGVKGSPTLVINGSVSSAGRDSASLMTAVCDAFNEKPEACNTEMSSTSPSSGFGWKDGEAATGSAQCS